jgi:hypothetical protein
MSSHQSTTSPGEDMSFRELLHNQIDAARGAAAANDLIERHELAQWWRWRVRDLEEYLENTDPGATRSDAA